jgi:hypothetical protein
MMKVYVPFTIELVLIYADHAMASTIIFVMALIHRYQNLMMIYHLRPGEKNKKLIA